MARPAAILDILVTANTGQATAALARVQGQMDGMAASGARSSGVLSRAAGVMKATAIAGAIVGATAARMSADFTQSMTLISTQAGATQKEVKKLHGEVIALARHSVFTPNDLATGLYHVESAGFRGAKAMSVLNHAQKLATVGQSDLETTTYAYVSALKTGIDGTQNMTKAAGLLNAIVGHGDMRMQQLTSALNTGVLPAAKNFGVSLREVGAALDTLTVRGVPAQLSATRLRMSMSMLGAPTAAAAKELGKINLSALQLGETMQHKGLIAALELLKSHLKTAGDAAQQADVISRSFGGGRTSSALITLIQNVGDLKNRYDQIGASAGDFNEKLKEAKATPINQLRQAWSQLSGVLINLGDKIVPDLSGAVEDVVRVISDPKISTQEKISKVFDMATKAAENALPKIAAFGVQAGEKIISGIWDAFTGSSPLGKLLIGGTLLRVFGGREVFSKAGSTFWTSMFGSKAAREKAILAAEETSKEATLAAGTVGKEAAYAQGEQIAMAQQAGYMTALTEQKAIQGGLFRTKMPGTGRFASVPAIAGARAPVSPAELAAGGGTAPMILPTPIAGGAGTAMTTVEEKAASTGLAARLASRAKGLGMFPKLGSGISGTFSTIGNRAGGAMMGALMAQVVGGAVGGSAGSAISNVGTGAAVGSIAGPWGAVAGAAGSAILAGWNSGLDAARNRTKQFAADLKTVKIPLHLTPEVDSDPQARKQAAAAHTAALGLHAGSQLSGVIPQFTRDRRATGAAIAADENLVSAAIKEHGKNSLAASEAESRLVQAEDAHRRSAVGIKKDLQGQVIVYGKARDAIHVMMQATEASAQVPDNHGNLVRSAKSVKELAAETRALRRIQLAQELATINSGRAIRGLAEITGKAREKLTKFANQFKGIPGVRHLLLTTNSPEALTHIASVSEKLDELGKRKTVAHILANTDNAQDAYRKLSKVASSTMDDVHKDTAKQSQAAADAATHAGKDLHHGMIDNGYAPTQKDAQEATNNIASQTAKDGKTTVTSAKGTGQAVWKQLGGSFLNTAIAAATGIDNIKGNTQKALKAFGVGTAINFAVDVVKAITGGGGGQNAPAKQQGGLAGVVPGSMPGDRHTLSLNGVPLARLESGEGIFIGNSKLMASTQAANDQVGRHGPVQLAKGGKAKGAGSPFTFPFPGSFTWGRIDQGADFAGTTPVVAIGDAVITSTTDLFTGPNAVGSGGVVYKLAAGAPKGYGPTSPYIFTFEGVNVNAHVGQHVKEGQRIGTMLPISLETGFASGSSGVPLTPYAGAADGTQMPAGKAMMAFLRALAGGKQVLAGGAAGGGIPPKVRKLMQKIQHTALKGPGGPLKDMGQSSLDKVEKAANAYIRKHAPAGGTTGTGGFISGGQGSVLKVMNTVLKGMGMKSHTAIPAIMGNSYGESSWNPDLVSGLFGFLVGDKGPGALDAYAKRQGKSRSDVATQVNFMGTTFTQAQRAAMNSLSMDAGVDYFLNNWEGAPGQGVAMRHEGAAKARAAGYQRGGRPAINPGDIAMDHAKHHPHLHGRPYFTHETGTPSRRAYELYHRWAKRPPYYTSLGRRDEHHFERWAQANPHIAPLNRGWDYDYRGWWQHHQGAHGRYHGHFPDTWKTPYDTTFSRESKYANRANPLDWFGQTLANIHSGRIFFRGAAQNGGEIPWFGGGGSIVAHKPTLIGIGDRGSEKATITKLGSDGGGAPPVIRPVFHLHFHGDGAALMEDIIDKVEVVVDESDAHDRRLSRMHH